MMNQAFIKQYAEEFVCVLAQCATIQIRLPCLGNEVFKFLKKEGFQAEIIDEVVEILKICDESDYAGTKDTASNLDSILQRSLLVLKKIK